MAMMLWLAAFIPTLAAEVETQATDSATAVVRESVRHRRTQVPLTDNKKDKSEDSELVKVVNLGGDTVLLTAADTVGLAGNVELIAVIDTAAIEAMGKKREFNPNPTTALWMSALCPGLGQIYNRRYWKLPIVVGAFVGLSYGTSWNNRMFQDYSRAYRDAMDDDPETRSYMNFYPPTVKESDLDMSWLQKALKNKKNYYRRYRDICILAMVGVYALSIIDAYVDASLAHFDISPDLSLQVAPTVLDNEYSMSRKPSFGVQCAFNF